MKKLILLVCFLLVSSMSYSQIIENFNYSAGTLLTSVGWTVASGGAVNAITVTSPGLSFPNYIGSNDGLAATLTTSGEDDYNTFPSQTTGSVYASFMMNVTAAQTTGDYFFSITTLTNGQDARLFAKSSGAGYVLGLTKINEPPTYGTTVYAFGTTYLVIDKYTFNAGVNDDATSLYVYAPGDIVPFVEPVTPTIGPLSTGTDATNLTRVLLRQGSAGNAPSLIIDGIYTETSWNNSVLPVELASFSSSVNGNNVNLNWSTASETNNSGFDIERNSNGTWSKVGDVAGNGTTLNSNNYSFTDRNVASGSYNYRLKQIDFNGNFEYFNLSNEVNIGIPANFELSQNYPNPFNPSTKINYDLPVDGKVSIKLFDMSGKEVATLVNEVKTAGYYSVNFNASSLSSGIYFYSISANNFTATKKMMLIK